MSAAYLTWLVAAWLFLAATVAGFVVHAVGEARRRRAFERHVVSALSLLVQRSSVVRPGEYVISAGAARRGQRVVFPPGTAEEDEAWAEKTGGLW